MTITITSFWWAIPSCLTIIAWFTAIKRIDEETRTSRGDYSSIGDALVVLFYGGAAMIATLSAWLLYFIMRTIYG